MKRKILRIGTALCLMLALCGQQASAQTAEKVKSGQESLAQQKQEYQDKLAKKMGEYKRELKDLKDKAAQAKDDAKARLDKQVADLERQTADLEKKLKAMESATGKAWDEMKAQAETAMDKLEKAFKEATSNLKK